MASLSESERITPKPGILGGNAYIYRAGYADYFYPNVPFDMMVGVRNSGTSGDYFRVELCDNDTGAVLYTSPEVYLQAGGTFLFVASIAVDQTTTFHCRANAYCGSSLDDWHTYTIPYDINYPKAEITAFNIVPNPVPEGDSTTVSITAKNIGPASGNFCIGIYSDQHGTVYSDWFWVGSNQTFSWSRVLSNITYSQICMPQIWWWNGTESIEVDYGFAAIYLLLPPVCEDYINQIDCEAAGCYWYDGSCHTEPLATDLCAWLAEHGAPNILITDVFTIINSYLFETPPTGYTFVPTMQNVFGVIDYYFGFDGDAATGCDFFP